MALLPQVWLSASASRSRSRAAPAKVSFRQARRSNVCTIYLRPCVKLRSCSCDAEDSTRSSTSNAAGKCPFDRTEKSRAIRSSLNVVRSSKRPGVLKKSSIVRDASLSPASCTRRSTNALRASVLGRSSNNFKTSLCLDCHSSAASQRAKSSGVTYRYRPCFDTRPSLIACPIASRIASHCIPIK